MYFGHRPEKRPDEREKYVYNEIIRNKDKFSEAKILFSQRYIYKLRHGNWPPQDWKGFEEWEEN